MEKIGKIQFSDPNGFYKRLEAGMFDSLESYQLSVGALRFLISNVRIETEDDCVAKNILQLRPFPHQYKALKNIWNNFECRAILADEVGLGKTLTAIIVIAELLERVWAKNILILARKSHCYDVWKAELEKHLPKYASSFVCNYDEGFNWNKLPSLLICSHTAARNNEDIILRKQWDLIVIDEAHHFRNLEGIGVNPSQLAEFGRNLGQSPKVERLILMTATPLQTKLWNLYSLLKILSPTKFGTPRQFAEKFIADDPMKARRPKNIEALRNELSEFVVRTTRKESGLSFPNRKVMTRRAQAKADEMELYQNVSEYIVNRWNQFSPEVIEKIKQFLLNMRSHCFNKQSDSISFLTLKQRLDYALESSRKQVVKGLDGKVIIQNFLNSVYEELYSANLFSKQGISVTLYEHLVGKYISTEYVRKKQSYKLALIRAQEMAMSSPGALRSHLKGKLPGVETEWEKKTIQQLLDQTEAVIQRGKVAKIQALLRVINELTEKKEKLIVFTKFRGTIDFLKDELEKNRIPCFTYTGDLSTQARGFDKTSERSRKLKEFKDSDWSILISTDAGAEGLNLQFCGVIVNYDLPWNPMIVEQRIGRIHRLGQERPNVFVYNLAVKDSIEDNIVLRLYERLNLFELAIGEMDEVLSRVADEESVEEILQDHILAVLTKKTEAEKEAEKMKLEAKLKEALEEAQTDKQFMSILGSINIDNVPINE